MIHSINPQSNEAEPEDCAGNSRPETTGRHTVGRPLDGVLESSQHSLPPAVDTERFGGRGSPPLQWSGWGGGGGRWGNCCLFGMVLLPEANSPLVLLAGGSGTIYFLLEMVLPHELLKQHYGSEQSFTTVELCHKWQQRVRKKILRWRRPTN